MDDERTVDADKIDKCIKNTKIIKNHKEAKSIKNTKIIKNHKEAKSIKNKLVKEESMLSMLSIEWNEKAMVIFQQDGDDKNNKEEFVDDAVGVELLKPCRLDTDRESVGDGNDAGNEAEAKTVENDEKPEKSLEDERIDDDEKGDAEEPAENEVGMTTVGGDLLKPCRETINDDNNDKTTVSILREENDKIPFSTLREENGKNTEKFDRQLVFDATLFKGHGRRRRSYTRDYYNTYTLNYISDYTYTNYNYTPEHNYNFDYNNILSTSISNNSLFIVTQYKIK